MLGDSGVGKTCLIQRFIEDQYAGEEGTSPTLAWDFKVKAVSVDRPPSEKSDVALEDKELVRLYVWDTAGQERFRHIARMYYKDVCGVMLCFDLTDVESFKNLKYWIDDLHTHAPDNVVKILVGNKQDKSTGENSAR